MRSSRLWRSINNNEGGFGPLLFRAGQSLRKIHLKTAAAGIAQVLLADAAVFLVLLFVFPFAANLFNTDALFLIVSVSAIALMTAVTGIVLFVRPQISIRYSNRLSRDARNTILTVAELLSKSHHNNVELELIEEFNTVYSLNAQYSNSRINRFLIYSVLSMTAIILLQMIIMPVWISNAYSLTEKAVVLYPVNGRLELKSWNAGTAAGRLYIYQDSTMSIYNRDEEYRVGEVLFIGPMVRSNSVKIYMLNMRIADSLVTETKPALYQKSSTKRTYSSEIEVPEYAAVKTMLYTPYGNKEIFSLKSAGNDTTVNFRLLTYSDSINIKMKKDGYPVIRAIIADDDRLKSVLRIPFIVLDDYGIEYAGAIIKAGSREDTVLSKNADSLLVLELSTDRYSEEAIEITGFAKDNNPYRKQITFTEPYRIRLNERFEIIKDISDSVGSVEEFTDMADDIRARLENIKSSINSDNRKAFEELKEQAKEMGELTEDIRENISKLGEYKLSEEISRQMMEIKKKAESIEAEVLKEVFKDLYRKDAGEMSYQEINKAIKENADKILKSLEQLSKMLDKLKEVTELSSLKEMMKDALENQKQALESDDESYKDMQKDITQKLEEMAGMSEEKKSLYEYSEELNDMQKLSKDAEKNRKTGEQLKNEMEKMLSKLNQKMQNSGMTSYDKNEIIMNLQMTGHMIDRGEDAESIKEYYREILAYVSKEGMPGPLEAMLSTGIKLCSDNKSDREELARHNFRMIAYLLLSQKQSGSSSSMSLEQMMNSMKSMSDKEMSISNALWEIFSKGQGEKGMTDEMAKMQEGMADELRKMAGSAGDDMMGDMEALADSLEGLAKDLKNGKLDRQTIDKEKRILNRMLTLQKSLYKQGLTDKRESKPGEEYNAGPKILLPDELGDIKFRLRKQLEQYLGENRNREYSEFIRRYYLELLK